MKKLLALTLALTMSAAMLASCGDSADTESSKKEEPSSTPTTSAPEEESEAEDTTTTTTTAAEEEEPPVEEAGGPQGLDVLAGKLLNYENASLKFALDTDVSQFVYPFVEPDGNDKLPGDEGYSGNQSVMDFSVQDVGGIPMMKVAEVVQQWKDADDNIYYEETEGADRVYTLRKFDIDLDKLFAGHEEDLAKIFSVKIDIVAITQEVAKDGDDEWGKGIYWMGGEFGPHNVDAWSGNWTDFALSSDRDDDAGWINQWAYTELSARPGIMGGEKAFGAEDNLHNYIYFQTWATGGNGQLMDFYIADIVFEDEDGNLIVVPEENIPGGASYDAVDPLGE